MLVKCKILDHHVISMLQCNFNVLLKRLFRFLFLYFSDSIVTSVLVF